MGTCEIRPQYPTFPVGYKKALYVNKALENLLYSDKEPFGHGGIWGSDGESLKIRGKNRVQGVFNEAVRILNTP